MRVVYGLVMLAFSSTLLAQPAAPNPKGLTIDRIFASDEFRGDRFAPVKWLAKGAYTTLVPSKSHKGASDLVQVDETGKGTTLLSAEKLIPPGAKEALPIQDYELSQNQDLVLIFTNSVKVWRRNTRGDYWLYQRSTGKLNKVAPSAKPASLMFAKLSPEGTRVGYVRDNDLYVEPVGGGAAISLTQGGSADVIHGTFDWVYEEEFDCRDGWRWSQDGKSIAYWQIDTRGVKSFTLVDNTSSNYPVLKTFAYPKTGERNSRCRVGVVPATGGTTKWIDIPGDTTTDFYIPRMEWIGSTKELVIQRINRLQNAIDVWLADATTGQSRKIHTDRDGAWIDLHDDALQWVEKQTAFTWISERNGWKQLEFVARDGRSQKRIIRGEFDVIRVLHLDEKANRVLFLASPENATQQYLYRAPLDGSSDPVRVTPADQPGWHDYNASPDGSVAIHTVSSFGKPPRIELISLADHQLIRVLASNAKLQQTLEGLQRTPVEFFQVDLGDGVKLDGWLMKPVNFDPAKKYPLLFYVYGEPAGQTVTDRWGGTNYLWHLMLTQQGYAVACIDNRGTPCPKGRDWRKSVYRKIGTLASEDQALAAKDLLKNRPYLDATRVGVWGWSGGGSMTLNQMFRHPNLYHLGMSIASVPDMRLYDTIYQERYMGLPQDNAEDYRQGSPLTHAAGLKGKLLLVHGTGDDNCHYQGVEKLSNKLVELNKPFTLMPYPNRSHSINEGANTTRHLFALLTRYLNDNLPGGPKP